MTMITNPSDPSVQAIFLRGHCRMYRVGMKHSTLTPTRLRSLVERVTGEKFKRGAWDDMIAALTKVISA